MPGQNIKANLEAAREAIDEQLRKLEAGEITEDDLQAIKASLVDANDTNVACDSGC